MVMPGRQGIKRLMTFSQKRFPNTPSKCLEFRVRHAGACKQQCYITGVLALQGVQQALYPVSNEGDEDVIRVLEEAERFDDEDA